MPRVNAGRPRSPRTPETSAARSLRVAAAMSKRLFVLFLVSMTSACTTEIVTWEEPTDSGGEEDKEPEDDGGGDDRRDAEDDDSSEVEGIPVGRMPPPGGCRIWYPDRPPGRQPPPGSCDELRGRVPDGAWLLYRPDDEPRVYRLE